MRTTRDNKLKLEPKKDQPVLVAARCRGRGGSKKLKPGQSLVPKKYTEKKVVYTLTEEGKNLVRNPRFRKGEFCDKNFVPVTIPKQHKKKNEKAK